MKTQTVVLWRDDDAKHIGSLNTLGVSPTMQGKGIGLALTAGVMSNLKMRGCTHCYIQWTGWPNGKASSVQTFGPDTTWPR
ncbi:MAG: GNAT family N-acetyltransferase [Janthinobacterium lividum]